MTAGIADASLDADIEVESVITKEFASETANHIVSECLQLLGAKVNLESSKYQKYLRDTAVLQVEKYLDLHLYDKNWFRIGRGAPT